MNQAHCNKYRVNIFVALSLHEAIPICRNLSATYNVYLTLQSTTFVNHYIVEGVMIMLMSRPDGVCDQNVLLNRAKAIAQNIMEKTLLPNTLLETCGFNNDMSISLSLPAVKGKHYE